VAKVGELIALLRGVPNQEAVVRVRSATAAAALPTVTGTASSDLFSSTGHGLTVGDRVRFSALTGGAGLSTGVDYYVIQDGLTANQFRLSATPGGPSVNFTTDLTACTQTGHKSEVSVLVDRAGATVSTPGDGTSPGVVVISV